MDNLKVTSRKNSKVETDNLNNTSIKIEECFALHPIFFFVFILLTIIAIMLTTVIYYYLKTIFIPLFNDYIAGYYNGIEVGINWTTINNVTYATLDKPYVVQALIIVLIVIIVSIICFVFIYKFLIKNIYKYRVNQIIKFSQDSKRKDKKSYITNSVLVGWRQETKKSFGLFAAPIILFLLIFSLISLFKYGFIENTKNLIDNGLFNNSAGENIIKQIMQNNDKISFRLMPLATDNYVIYNRHVDFPVTYYLSLVLIELLYGIVIIVCSTVIVRQVELILHNYCPVCTIYRRLEKKDVYKSIDSQIETKKEWTDIEVRNKYSNNTYSNPYTIQTMKDQQYDVQTHVKSRLYKCNYCENEIIDEKITKHSYKIN